MFLKKKKDIGVDQEILKYSKEKDDDFFRNLVHYYMKFVNEIRVTDEHKKQEVVQTVGKMLHLYMDSLKFEQKVKTLFVVNPNHDGDESYILDLIHNMVTCHDRYEEEMIMSTNDTKWV